MGCFKECGEHVELLIKVVPNSKKSEIVGIENEMIKIKLAALPIEGRANEELVAFLSKRFKIAKRDIDIISGELGRQKRVRLVKNEKVEEFLKGIESE